MREVQSLENDMARAQQGDTAAYKNVLETITPILRSFVTKKLNRSEDVEDVVQEILVSIHKASHTYDTNRPFKTWMYTIASHRVSDFLRAHYRKGDERHAVDYDDIAYGIANDADVTDSYETSEYLDKALSELPDNQRKIIEMMKLEGYSVAETAGEMNMSESAVKVAAHRAMKILSQKAKA